MFTRRQTYPPAPLPEGKGEKECAPAFSPFPSGRGVGGRFSPSSGAEGSVSSDFTLAPEVYSSPVPHGPVHAD